MRSCLKEWNKQAGAAANNFLNKSQNNKRNSQPITRPGQNTIKIFIWKLDFLGKNEQNKKKKKMYFASILHKNMIFLKCLEVGD